MRTKHNFLPGDRVTWNEGNGKIWVGTIERLADEMTLVVKWDASGESTMAPAWSRRLRREITCWSSETVTSPDGW